MKSSIHTILNCLILLCAGLYIAPARVDAAVITATSGQSLSPKQYWYREFSITKNGIYLIHFASQANSYSDKPQFVVASRKDLVAFQHGNLSGGHLNGAVNVLSRLVRLSPGDYFVGVRGATGATTRFSVNISECETPYNTSFPVSGDTTAVNPGGARTISIPSGKNRIVVTGCHSGNMGIYVIPVDEKYNFLNGESFKYLSSFGSKNNSGSLPGRWELNLGSGDYLLAIRNSATSGSHTSTSMSYFFHYPSNSSNTSNTTGGSSGSSGSSAAGDAGSEYRELAGYYYSLFASFGYHTYASAYYYFFEGMADYSTNTASGRIPEADFAYFNGFGLYFYFIYSDYSPTSAQSNYYFYLGHAYYYYYIGHGDPSSAKYYYNALMNAAFGL